MSEAEAAPEQSTKVQTDRVLLQQAAEEGKLLSAYVRLSGPGWLQSAITLGGGSLASALFLGVLGGYSVLWLQLVAIVLGVIMLSAISYVTLSTGRRPFEAINSEINPVLGWGWLIATVMANMIWCMPQFSLCYDALDKNLFAIGEGSGLGNSDETKMTVSAILLVAAGFVVLLNTRRGVAGKLFDVFLKLLVGMVVICFFGVVILMAIKGELNIAAVLAGLVPDFNQWTTPGGDLAGLIETIPEAGQTYWSSKLVGTQRAVMIAAAATAVGINMTFLLPYSMLSRGWDKPFRGLARFDLATGMAIPYVIVTSCVVIAAASMFHAKIDDQLASSDLQVMQQSPMYESVIKSLQARVDSELEEGETLTDEERLARVAELDKNEKTLALAMVKRNAFQLSQTLSPLLGETRAKLVFGVGVLGMGFSTIIILMLINGYAFREMFGDPDGAFPFICGCLVSGLFGACWVFLWSGDARFWLAIFTSSFGMMLLPIAYITFFLMMNSKRILGDEKPTGMSMVSWNVMMGVAVLGALAAAGTALYDKVTNTSDRNAELGGYAILALLVVYTVLIVIGFVVKRASHAAADSAN